MTATAPIFAGDVPQVYDRYLVPLIFEAYARDLASRVPVSRHGTVLETACGTGVVTRHLRRTLPPSARLVATDFAEPMLGVARQELGEVRGLDFRTADGTDLPFSDGSFEAVVCQFGVMFYPDRGKGYREAARVLTPGGAFVFNVWDSLERNPLAGLVHDVVSQMPDERLQFLQLPFGYYDVPMIVGELSAAGFADVDVSPQPGVSHAASARDVALAFVAGTPLAIPLAECDALTETLAQVEAAVIDEYGDGPVSAPMQSIAITAKTPER